MLKQKYFLTGIFILSAERQPIKLAWRKIVWLLIENYQYQELADGTAIYPKQYFYSTDANTGKITKYPELLCIHYADASWLSDDVKAELIRRRRLVKILGEKLGLYVDAFINYLFKDGLLTALKKTFSVLRR